MIAFKGKYKAINIRGILLKNKTRKNFWSFSNSCVLLQPLGETELERECILIYLLINIINTSRFGKKNKSVREPVSS